MSRLLIAGGGLAGCLCALALARRRPDVPFLLVEEADQFGGNHTWSRFDTDVPADLAWVGEGIATRRWPDHDIAFPRRRRTIPIGYNSIRSADLDAAVRATLRPDQYRLNSRIEKLSDAGLTVDGKFIAGTGVIDARGPVPTPGLQLGWQKFVGRFVRFEKPHGIERPVIMDATVGQHDGYRFVYTLPMSPTELLVEDTYYSADMALDPDTLRARIDAEVSGYGIPATVIEEEQGILPIVMGGSLYSLWHGSPVALLGLRGGFFHPTTSYSSPDAIANAALLAEQQDFSSAALRRVFHARARDLWNERGFFRLLNRMLFKAAAPGQSYRVLEHFYRLPPAVIGRFYAAQLTALDKVRILSGKPPVPVGRAVRALAGAVR
ncbi:lycopene beta-cyclase CrtY [Sphingomonas sabuli]|uniref:Lycopene beta-cyclase CrtY n=1 Tax=Sphingomonas sabuli TaxID=2764186 RepID=A0A7G9KZT5_9SPHN|nr:lycopene beta-cyclase CrtY [Sphingomonas sabuli]QNM81884.1 lycopene beta-cyclase CrtY [Sphingomonas sabuli]